MASASMTKWLRWFSPLLGGRFDFFAAAAEQRFDAWACGLAMTRGRFWTRVRGGHDLRRAVGRAPTERDPLAGRADGRAGQVSTFPWVLHPNGSIHVYALFAVGQCGCVETGKPPAAVAAVDGAGRLVGPAPNPVLQPQVAQAAGGRFLIRWHYDESGQEAAPAEFLLFNDAASPGAIDYDAVVAAVPYRRRAAFFEHLSIPFAHGARVRWAVRARSADGVIEQNAAAAAGVAESLGPALNPGFSFGPQSRP